MCDGTIPTERTEKQMAQGFLRKWEKGSLQLWLTAVIYDLCNIFKILQLLFQKSNLILPDIISGKDGAIESLKLMAEIPFPGGKEEGYHEGCQVVINGYETNVRQTAKAHRFATPRSRDKGAIRRETVQSVKNFLVQRMIVEENDTINNLIKILEAKSPKELIEAAGDLATQMFGKVQVSQFVSDVCQSWQYLKKIDHNSVSDCGKSYALNLRKMTQASTGLLKMFLASFLAISPHRMATERAVSHYNNIKTSQRASLKQQTINSIMHISLNGKGTAYFDPRPAICEFLQMKDRRNSQPDRELYKRRDFIKKFFTEESGIL